MVVKSQLPSNKLARSRSNSTNIQSPMIIRDKDQRLVETPFGKGIVRRRRQNSADDDGPPVMEIELDWGNEVKGKNRGTPNMLYSTTNFPSLKAELNSEVLTSFGRGKVVELRDDNMIVVRISSWRLARRSVVLCYLNAEAAQVVKPREIFEMNVHEKIEHAQGLKKEAAVKFSGKSYEDALQLYSKAVDAVRYVQHRSDSTNEVRADLLIVMITCCNNAGTCCLLLDHWEETYKFGKNALVLLDALYDKRKQSKILKLLYNEGLQEEKLFGTWKVKSLTLIARGLAARHELVEALSSLKKALDVIALYRKDGCPMFQQLVSQEKEIRKLHTNYRQRIKEEKKKERKYAKAMFDNTTPVESKGVKLNTTQVLEEKKTIPPTPNSLNSNQTPSVGTAQFASPPVPKKRVCFVDGPSPGYIDPDEDKSFLDEHKEALLLLAGGFLGSAALLYFTKNRR